MGDKHTANSRPAFLNQNGQLTIPGEFVHLERLRKAVGGSPAAGYSNFSLPSSHVPHLGDGAGHPLDSDTFSDRIVRDSEAPASDAISLIERIQYRTEKGQY